MAATVLKIKREGELFRFTLHGEPSYETVAAAIATAWPELVTPEPTSDSLAAGLGALQGRAKYVDDEGDLCTLTPQTFNDFLMLHKRKEGTDGGRVLKLELQPPPATIAALPQPSCGSGAPEGHRAPPGLGLSQGPGSEGQRGMVYKGPCMGPKRLLLMIKALQQSGWLSNEMLARLAEQGLPVMTQRVARKVDKINHMARQGQWQNLRKLVEALAVCALETPGLEQHAGPLQEALLEEPGPAHLGESLLGLLKSAGALSFEAKVRLVEALRDQLLPVLEDVASELGIEHTEWEGMQGLPSPVHVGVTCDGCGMTPIVGPRFRCTTLPDYDLCGHCYPKKEELLGADGKGHEFKCILKGKGKGKGKGKSCKGFWHFLKGAGGKGGGSFGGGFWPEDCTQAGTAEDASTGAQGSLSTPPQAHPWEYQPWWDHCTRGGPWWG